MATQTIDFTFNNNNFTSDSPSYSGYSDEYSSKLRFNTVTKTLLLNNTNYSRGIFTISIPSGIDLGLIHFNTPNGSIVSISDEIDGIYELCNFENTTISKPFTKDNIPDSGTKTYYVIINGDPNSTSQHLNVSIALAKEGSIPSSDKTVTLTYDCDGFEDLNEYTVGLHTYSAYDAKESNSDLTTKLYSATTIESWGINTSVYSSPYLNNPALNYFYGYNNKVYRVGDEWSRSYGIKFRYEVRVTWHWFFKRKTKSKRVTLGPMESLSGGNQPTSEACIEPTMRNVGKIRKIYNDDSLISKPLQYRYYMGYDSSNKRNSNDSVFTTYSLPKKKHFPITGLMHVFKKFTRGIINGFNKSWDGDVNWAAIAGGTGFGLVAAIFGESILEATASFFYKIPGPFPALNASGLWSAAGLSTFFLVLAILLILWKLLSFFSPKTHHYREDCKNFLHHFTDSPYINTGNTLYRDDDLSIINNGYYCDGVYYYRQQSNSITQKTLSSTSAFVAEDKPLQFLYSLPADNPILVEDWQKLVLLPYTSGKPLPYCGGSTVYKNVERTHTIETHCCELENCNEPIILNFPYGTITSCLSQEDADNKAIEQFQAAIDYAEDHSIYSTTINDEYIGQLDVNFTHEIKEEDNPTSMALFFDKRNGPTVTVGTSLYYDFSGCQKALPGYYATSNITYPVYYYKVEEGKISAIYLQSAASSTTTTTGQNIIKTKENYSSNWYLKSTLKNPLSSYIFSKNNRTFDINSLFSTSEYTLSAGRIISGSYTDGAFEKHNTFDSDGVPINTSTTEQGTGWYVPLNPWKPEGEDIFFYQNSLTAWEGGPWWDKEEIYSSTFLGLICNGGNTGTIYYHDGENLYPSLGDKVYNTNNITDSIEDGFIKYNPSSYFVISKGVVIETNSYCEDDGDDGDDDNNNNLTPFQAGSMVQNWEPCDSVNIVLYGWHDGINAGPSVGDTCYGPNKIDTVNESVRKYFPTNSVELPYILYINNSGVVEDIVICSDD